MAAIAIGHEGEYSKAIGSERLVYICEVCHFEFERMSGVEQCPDCGKNAIRKATEQESEAFRKRLQEDVWNPEKPSKGSNKDIISGCVAEQKSVSPDL